MNNWIVLIPTKDGRLPKRIPFESAEANYKQINCGPVWAYFQRDGRFRNDQLFTCDERGLAICDGVILNLAELKKEYGADGIAQVIRSSWEETKGLFFKKFAGPFCGAVYDRENNTFTAYVNQTGDTFVFYYHTSSFHAVSNNLNMLDRLMKENGLSCSLDEDAALYLLTYGWMVDERTLFQEIKRLSAGNMLRITGEGESISAYHRFDFTASAISFPDAIELLDTGFRKAVHRCFEKDREYGVTEHLIDLSGGFDSRMVAWVANDMGYAPQVYINYCQSCSDELRCASKVASALGGQFFHKQLDDASFLYEIDRLVDLNYGLSTYCGMTGNDQFLRSLNFKRFGLEHTGQLGDVIIGSYSKKHETLPEGQHNLKSSTLIFSEAPAAVLAEHATFEDFALYVRGFLGILSSHLIRRNHTYQVSPFIDPDFFSLCMSIPLEYRQNHKLYWAWMDSKYPQASILPSTNLRSPAASFVKRAYNYAVRKGGSILRNMGLVKAGLMPNNMNPFDYWYDTKPALQEFIADYYQKNRSLLDPFPETRSHVDLMYTSRTVDKLLALTLLAAVKRYFPNE